jgi:two-component system, LytTR family, sensor kinase
MTETAVPANKLRTALVIAVAWTIFGILASAHFFLSASPDRASFIDLATHIVTFYWAWAILTPPILALARRATTLTRGHRVLLVATILIVAIPAHAVLYLTSLRLIEARPDVRIDAANFFDYVRRHTGGDLATCALLIAFTFHAETTRRAKERESATAKLEQRLARAEVEILRWQLQPHFLFNALNTVSTLVLKSDTAGAEQAISLIARYLRSVLNRGEELVTLDDELRFVTSYVEIEKLRFGDALKVDEQVTCDARTQRVPAMMLQPLVENAIRHGAPPASSRCIKISARVVEGRVLISVRNTTASTTRAAEGNGGFGLAYVRQRLAHWYGTSASLEMHATDNETVVNLDLPVTK